MQLQESFNSPYNPDPQSHNKVDETCAISFLISTYNRACYVEACVRHLLSIQTPYSIEVIVRDNASEDNTKSIIESVSDPRLKYIRAPMNQSTISFLEVGRLAKGEVITWLSDEDDFEYEHLDYILSTFREDPACSVLIGSVTVGPNSTEVLFPERVIMNTSEALLCTLQFSGCGGVFVRGELFRSNCDIHLADQYEAYKTWNYYPIGFFATACFEQKLITTSTIVVRQTRQAPTTDNWSEVGNAFTAPTSLYPHYYPKSICDRLYSNLIIVLEKENLSTWAKLKISARLAVSFINQIDSVLHPDLIELLAVNYSKGSVDAYQRYIQRKGLHIFLIRKLWVVYQLLSMSLRFILYHMQIEE